MAKNRSRTSGVNPATIDRGPAKYFHGRKKILNDFRTLTERTSLGKIGGTTFLIQGAPGVGKSALLHECAKIAEKKSGWHVAKIKTGALWDTGKMMRSLDLGKMIGIGGISMSLLEAFEAQVALSKPKRKTSSLNIVEKRKRRPLLLVLDEAQKIASAHEQSPDRREDAKELLEAIHNGELNKQVILLVAGLGTTLASFESLGISRFAKNCCVQLGRLSKESERAVIHDWLFKEGGAKGDPENWINAIAKETHGWPHHIISYVDPAVYNLRDNNGMMTEDGLEDILKAGQRGRLEYYKERAYGFPEEVRQSLAKVFSGVPLEGNTTQKKIISRLSQDIGSDKADKLFDRFLEKGLLNGEDGRFAIPIPSMHSWLVDCYVP